jgi:hypothetical protein
MSNSERFPEAWKVYNDCVRKWEETDLLEYPEGWKYGIPNPNPTCYLTIIRFCIPVGWV